MRPYPVVCPISDVYKRQGASLYIRPLLIGTSAQVGVHPAEEYMFVVFVTPVGPYFKGGFSTNPVSYTHLDVYKRQVIYQDDATLRIIKHRAGHQQGFVDVW